jgi:predicted aspartyl protease
MNLLKISITTVLLLSLAWAGSALFMIQRNTTTPARIESTEIQNRNKLEIEYQEKLREIQLDHTRKKLLATGETVFDRTYNTQEQGIAELIQNLASEALPETWSSEVKVEEFTHFILLIYLPHDSQQLAPSKVVAYLGPILEYSGWLLTDIAVFDRTHSSYMFLDKTMLDEIENYGKLSKSAITRAEQQGQSFTQFNSIVIECEKQDSHLFVPIEVVGPTGIIATYALLDTGASTTTLTNEIISKTGSDDLQVALRRRFSTANGTATFPIVTREVNVGGIRNSIEVAVDQKDSINLLGVNYFEGMDYLIDSQNSAIYVWKK